MKLCSKLMHFSYLRALLDTSGFVLAPQKLLFMLLVCQRLNVAIKCNVGVVPLSAALVWTSTFMICSIYMFVCMTAGDM